MSSKRLEGKICVITGAAGRIGQNLVTTFLKHGAVVVAVDIKIPEQASEESGRLTWFQVDQTSPESITKLEKYLSDKYGRLDCLVNNGASGGNLAPFHEKSLAEFDAIMAVNIRGPFLLMQMAIRLMLKANTKGSIINMASTAGYRASPMASIYSSSKFCLIGMNQNVAMEYASHGIRCNSISPGVMQQPNIQGFSDEQIKEMHSKLPMARGGQPNEVAMTAVFLASDEAAYISGTDILVDGAKIA